MIHALLMLILTIAGFLAAMVILGLLIGLVPLMFNRNRNDDGK